MEFILGTIKTRPGRRDELLGLCIAHSVVSRAEPGCIYLETAPSAEDPTILVLAECWQRSEDHDAHTRLQHFADFQAKLAALAVSLSLHSIVTEDARHIDVTF